MWLFDIEHFIFLFSTLRCRKHKEFGCLARMTKSGDRFFCRGHHNNENEEDVVGRIAVENECKRRAAEQPERPRLIFEQARQALVVTSFLLDL